MVSMYPTTKRYDYTFLQYLDGKDDKEKIYKIEPDSVLFFIKKHPQLNKFYEIIKIADMESEICNMINKTFFIPILPDHINLLYLDQLEARKIVSFCILNSKLYKRDLITGLFDTLLINRQLWIDNGVLNRRSKIINYDIEKGKNLIHVIDRLPF